MRVATLEEERESTIDGEVFTEIEDIGHVTYGPPRLIQVAGKWVENVEEVGTFIRLHIRGLRWRWSGNLDDYDVDTTDHDPDTNPRWEAE